MAEINCVKRSVDKVHAFRIGDYIYGFKGKKKVN
jgi:hypothetical protein